MDKAIDEQAVRRDLKLCGDLGVLTLALLDAKDAEIARLTAALTKANAGFEEYERRFYLEQDKAEQLRVEVEAMKGSDQ